MKAEILVETEGLSREDWLKYRKRGIGGSDVAAILGISKWKSAVGLWLDKTNQANEPEIYQKYVKTSTSRRFTVK